MFLHWTPHITAILHFEVEYCGNKHTKTKNTLGFDVHSTLIYWMTVWPIFKVHCSTVWILYNFIQFTFKNHKFSHEERKYYCNTVFTYSGIPWKDLPNEPLRKSESFGDTGLCCGKVHHTYLCTVRVHLKLHAVQISTLLDNTVIE